MPAWTWVRVVRFSGKVSAVADGFHRLRIQPGPDRGAVQAIGVFVELVAHLAHKCLQGLPFAGGQLADGLHAVLGQQLPGRAAHIQQISHRQGPDDGLASFPGR